MGHVLFSAVRLAPPRGVSARLLAPLAVHPQLQSRGIGRALVEEGCRRLAEQGVDLVFVLANAHPGAILVLHDRPDTIQATLATLRAVVPELRRRGYVFVALDVLCAPEAGDPIVKPARSPHGARVQRVWPIP